LRETIYIVEDDDGHAELIRTNLREACIGTPIRRFENGFEAMDAIFPPGGGKGEIPLLMLLDLNMPGMRGTEVIEKLRGHARTRSLPIVVLTTSSDAEEIERCYALGCNLFLAKPIEYEQFVSVIRRLGLVLSISRLPD